MSVHSHTAKYNSIRTSILPAQRRTLARNTKLHVCNAATRLHEGEVQRLVLFGGVVVVPHRYADHLGGVAEVLGGGGDEVVQLRALRDHILFVEPELGPPAMWCIREAS